MKRGKVQVTIPATYSLDEALIDGLQHLGSLNELNLKKVKQEFHEPFKRLFGLAKERMALGGRDRHLPDLVEKVLGEEAREWVKDTDAKHTIASFAYLVEIYNDSVYISEEDAKRVLSAIIVHDCAYPKTKNFAEFTGTNAREQHMKDGVIEFLKFAAIINNEFNGFYSQEDITEVCAIVKQHDNPSLGKDFTYEPPKHYLMQAHREADRLWMLNKGGFALDIIRRLVEQNPWYDPEKYLLHVISRHIEEVGVYKDRSFTRLPFLDTPTLYRNLTSQLLFMHEIDERLEEYGVNDKKILDYLRSNA